MQSQYTRDDKKRRLRIAIREFASEEEVLAIVDRQAAEGTWSYAVLYDFRANVELPPLDLRKIAAHAQEVAAVHGPRGPVAIVTRAAPIVGSSQIYANLVAKAGFEVQVFWDIDEAERWLDSQQRE